MADSELRWERAGDVRPFADDRGLGMAQIMPLPEVEAVLIELSDGEQKMLDRIPDKIQSV